MKINSKYKASHITPKERHRIWWQLHDVLESNPAVWLHPTNRKDFCALLQTNQKYFSQTVNQATDHNITSLLNAYRLALFLKKLHHGEAQLKTIEGLAKEAGFRNRTSFYAAFQKLMGCQVSDLIHLLKDDQ